MSHSPSAPNFLGIGAFKCASTWIYRILQEHPEVFVSQPKELEYFSLKFGNSVDWYLGHFGRAGSAVAIGEVSTSYFHSLDAPRRIREFDPEMKIVLVLRDPVDRAVSHHRFLLQEGDLDPFFAAFGSASTTLGDYLAHSTYAPDLARWFCSFPRSQILVLLVEEILGQPIEAKLALYSFLEVNPEFDPPSLKRRANESYKPRSVRLKHLINLGTNFAEKIGVADHLWQIRHLAPVARILDLNRIPVDRETSALDASTAEALSIHFENDVLAVAELLGRDTLPWPTWQRASAGRKQ